MTRRFTPATLAALLAAAACSPEAAAPTPDNGQGETAEPTPPPANLATVADSSAAAVRAAAAEAPAPKAAAANGPARRCGWLSNPTPGNWWLTDREDQWILATQGREPVAGMDEMPDMSTAGWVETNGHYGYGCACMTVTWDPATETVTRIADAQPKPLKQCRADRKLPRPE